MFLSEHLAEHHKKYKDDSLIYKSRPLREIVKQLKSDKQRDVREPVECIPEYILEQNKEKEEDDGVDIAKEMEEIVE